MRIEIALAASLFLLFPASGVAETPPAASEREVDAMTEKVNGALRALTRAEFDRLVPLLR